MYRPGGKLNRQGVKHETFLSIRTCAPTGSEVIDKTATERNPANSRARASTVGSRSRVDCGSLDDRSSSASSFSCPWTQKGTETMHMRQTASFKNQFACTLPATGMSIVAIERPGHPGDLKKSVTYAVEYFASSISPDSPNLGMVTQNTEPWGRADFIPTWPFIAAAKCLTMAKPRPVPPIARERPGSTR